MFTFDQVDDLLLAKAFYATTTIISFAAFYGLLKIARMSLFGYIRQQIDSGHTAEGLAAFGFLSGTLALCGGLCLYFGFLTFNPHAQVWLHLPIHGDAQIEACDSQTPEHQARVDQDQDDSCDK